MSSQNQSKKLNKFSAGFIGNTIENYRLFIDINLIGIISIS